MVAYATLKGMEFHFDRCPYSKNAFREGVRRALNEIEERYPATKLKVVNAFLSQLELLKDGARFRHAGGKTSPILRCSTCGEPCSKECCNFCLLMGKTPI